MPKLDAYTVVKFYDRVKVQGINECWPWMGRMWNGYGLMEIDGRQIKAHRLALFLETGVDPAPLYACHHCDNPRCCNPKHLYKGSHADNMRDYQERKPKVISAPIDRIRAITMKLKGRELRAFVKSQVWGPDWRQPVDRSTIAKNGGRFRGQVKKQR